MSKALADTRTQLAAFVADPAAWEDAHSMWERVALAEATLVLFDELNRLRIFAAGVSGLLDVVSRHRHTNEVVVDG